MKIRRAALAAGLAALVVLAFAGALQNEFLGFDDPDYVTANPLVLGGLTLDGVGRAFSEFHAGNWHPLTWISHMADVELFGLDPAAHHAVNVALHVLNSVLVFFALASLTGTTWPAAFAAALFAVHPLRVESVAWIAERKDLLSTSFGLLALLCWTRWTRDRARASRLAALACFALALLSKPMLVTLPGLLLLLDFWPLERLRSRADLWPRVREKLGFFALSLGSCAVTLAAQGPGIIPLPLALRLCNALLAYPSYLALVFWPTRLAAVYPYPDSIAWSEVVGAAALLAGISAIALWQARRRPWLLVGWLWFAGMLVPTLGLVQVGVQAYADRYTYLPFVGLALALALVLAELVERAPQHRPLALGLASGAAVSLLALCVAATRAQVEVWHDTKSLFANAVALTKDSWYSHCELGVALAERGEVERARVELEESLRIHPNYPRAIANLGRLRDQAGQSDEGIALLRRALAIDPQLRGGQQALGFALQRVGRLAEAEAAFRAALERDPGDHDAALQLARLLATAPDASLRDGAAAVKLCERACGPGGCQSVEALDVLAMAYIEAGRRDDAVQTAGRAAELALARGDAKLAAKIFGRRASYERGQPSRVRLPTPSPDG